MRRYRSAGALLLYIFINLNILRVLGFGRLGAFVFAVYATLSVVLFVPRSRIALASIGRKLGLPNIDMNVEFQPEGVLLRALWIFSSAIQLTIQIPVYVLLLPLRLVLTFVLFFFRTTDVPSQIPSTATSLLLLIPKKDRDSLVGDLEEEFRTVTLPRYGARKARALYWEQVIMSLGAYLWPLVKYLAGFAFLWKAVKK